MNTLDLEMILKKHCPDIFFGVFPIDRLPKNPPPKRPLLLVCNTDKHDKPGKHWVAIYLDKNDRGEYFDSLGREPLKEFDKFLKEFSAHYVYNDLQIQSSVSFVCGYHVLLYSALKNLNFSMREIILMFSNDFTLNDLIVHHMYHRLFELK